MWSPLGPVLAVIIMVKLESSVDPQLISLFCFWKLYVKDTLTVVKEDSVNQVLQQSISFHSNLKFIFEIQSSRRITTAALKQQFIEKVSTQAYISTGSQLHSIMETSNICSCTFVKWLNIGILYLFIYYIYTRVNLFIYLF